MDVSLLGGVLYKSFLLPQTEKGTYMETFIDDSHWILKVYHGKG